MEYKNLQIAGVDFACSTSFPTGKLVLSYLLKFVYSENLTKTPCLKWYK